MTKEHVINELINTGREKDHAEKVYNMYAEDGLDDLMEYFEIRRLLLGRKFVYQ